MLAAEAVRLAAIEVLCPTAALVADSGYPTLAEKRVFDSEAPSLRGLDDKSYKPTLALYTVESGARLRGPASDAYDREADVTIDIVAELSVIRRENGEDFADAAENGETFAGVADSDANGRLVLAALTAQVRYLLEHAPSGHLFRRIATSIPRVEVRTFAVPELGLKWHRQTIRLHCLVDDDDFEVTAGELPEPCRTLLTLLPEQSYARAKLLELAAHFAPQSVPDLTSARIHTAPDETAEAFPQP